MGCEGLYRLLFLMQKVEKLPACLIGEGEKNGIQCVFAMVNHSVHHSEFPFFRKAKKTGGLDLRYRYGKIALSPGVHDRVKTACHDGTGTIEMGGVIRFIEEGAEAAIEANVFETTA